MKDIVTCWQSVLGSICEIQGSTLKCVWMLENEMAAHSSILAQRILWMEEPGGLQSIGLHRVGHD